MSDNQPIDPFDVLHTACKWLGLKPRERSVLRCCLWAKTQTSNGHFLASPGLVPAAERLIARDYLTKADRQMTPPVGPKTFGIVVVVSEANLSKLIADANATRAAP
jgi:hypothetical protein